MTPTDELRAELTRRGVEWTVPDESWNQNSITYWKVGSIKWVAFESENGTLWLNCNSVTDLTPAQAIAATLGSGTCELINAADDLGKGTSSCMCCSCGYTALDDWWDEFKYCPNCGKRIVEVTE